MSRTKLFLIGYFFPSWVAALMMWGDDRTSASFEAAPAWFYYTKFVIQIAAIMVLFLPFQLRRRPSLTGIIIAVALITSTFLTNPVLDAEFILINSSIQIAVLAIFLSIAQPSASIEKSDLKMFFLVFSAGFVLQVALYVGLGRTPSHSITDVFIRFNGITNDSLSAGLLLPLFVPWAVKSAYPAIKIGAIMLGAVLTGSLFGALIVPIAAFGYAFYSRLYRLVTLFTIGIIVAAFYFYAIFASIIDIKFLSIITHLRFFLDLSGLQYNQPKTSCSEEFCESFIENGLSLSPTYMVLFYLLLAVFLVPLLQTRRTRASMPLIVDTLRIYGFTVLAGSFVHPIPLIPFVVPLFLIFTVLCLRQSEQPVNGAARGIAAL